LTGENPEYQLSHWVPAQAQLLVAVLLFAYTSFGGVVFWQGLHEVDLMNVYVGSLLRESADPFQAVLLGWHPWSVCRGLGYLLLTFEVASLSLARFTGRPLSSGRRRAWRWGLGLGFLALDGVLKATLMEAVR